MNKELELIVSQMTPEVYERLAEASQTGRWADGRELTEAEKGHALQAVMLYQARHVSNHEHMMIDDQGEMVIKSKSELKRQFTETPIFRQPGSNTKH